MTIAVLPASFDPITRGHVDIISRASLLFDRLVVGVYAHPRKNVMFALSDRVAMVEESLDGMARVEVKPFEGLLVDFVRQIGASVVVRGLRWVSDFEYEFQQASANRRMVPGLETICMFANTDFVYFSSSIIKEIAENNGDVSTMVPEPVAARLRARVPAITPQRYPEEVAPSTF